MAEHKEPDGSRLRPMQWWELLHRTVFGIEHAGHRFVVDVRFLDDEARLHTDGVQTARARDLPVTFSVPGGEIEVATSLYGLKRMHLRTDDGEERTLRPARYTAEAWRAELARRRPALSRAIATTAVVVLLVGLVVLLPAVLERVTTLDAVAARVGTFTSPWDLPAWASTTLTVAGVVAAVERALTLRNHWLIDLDTLLWD